MIVSSIRLLSIVAATLAAIAVASASPLPPLPFFQISQPAPDLSLQSAQRTMHNHGSTFIENKGQWDRQVRFLLKSPGLDVWITERGMRYDLYRLTSIEKMGSQATPRRDDKGEPPALTRSGHVVGVNFEGAAFAPTARGIHQQPGAYNYFIGNDRTRWASGVRQFAEAHLENLYDGIDALFYLDAGRPRYDLVVQPGADPAQVQMQIEGSSNVSINADGSLAIWTSAGVLQQQGLYAYQEIDGVRRQVECRFVVGKDQRVNFILGAYDRSRTLVIDPLVYSTYVGGDDNEESNAIAVDTSGNAYITGVTASSDFPELHEYQGNRNDIDAFVTKLIVNDSGNVEPGWSTYLGGISLDMSNDIAVDANGNVYITGQTPSTDFPVQHRYQSSRGGIDVFVTKLAQSDTGSVSLVYSTYLGGLNSDVGYGIAVDSSGNAYVTGYTNSMNFPVAYYYQNARDQSLSDAFVTKLTYDGSGNVALAYSSYLGGKFTDMGYDIALDSNSNPCIVGITQSRDFPTAHQLDTLMRSSDVFITRMTTNDSGNLTLVYSTFLGGDGEEYGTGIATDDSGNVYVTGYTASTDFPTVNEYQTDQGSEDAFVAKLVFRDTGAVALAWSTLLGGDMDDVGQDIAVDREGNVYITGYTGSENFPTLKQDQTDQDGYDVFVAKLHNRDTGAVELLYSTYLSGSDIDKGYGLAVDGRGNAYVTGVTASDDFPAMNPYQPHQTGWDAFVTKLAIPIQLDIPAEPSGRTAIAGNHLLSPNPAHDNLRCSFTLTRTATVSIQIFTADGRMVSVPVQSEPYDEGAHRLDIPVGELPPGVYTLHVVAGIGSFTDQFVVVR